MRVIVLVLLGGAVLYLAWNEFGSGSVESPSEVMAEEGQPDPGDGPGRMRTPAEIEAQLAQAGLEQDPSGASQAPAPEAPAPQTAPPQQASPSTSQVGEGQAVPMVLDWVAGDPVEQGSLLLHDVERLPSMLAGPWSDLSEDRKALIFGYGLLIRGQENKAGEVLERVSGSPEVTQAEVELLRSVLSGGRPHPLPASSPRVNPLVLGARMALLAREAEADLREQHYARAASTLSTLLLQEIDAPWESDSATMGRWSQQLHEAQSMHRWSKDGDWSSFEVVVEPGDNLVAIRKRIIAAQPDMNLCTGLIERSNQLGKFVHPGDVLRIPSERVSTLVDLSSRWMFYLHGEEVVGAWQVAVGRDDSPTRPGGYVVGEKVPEPPWFKPGAQPVAYGHPDNPLGTRWIAWNGSNGLGFHGTWEPETLGSAASDGCIRMRNTDVEELFEILPRGSEIHVRP